VQAHQLGAAGEVAIVVRSVEAPGIHEAEGLLQARVHGGGGELLGRERFDALDKASALARQIGEQIIDRAGIVVGFVSRLVGHVCAGKRSATGEEVIEAGVREGFEIDEVADVVLDRPGPCAVDESTSSLTPSTMTTARAATPRTRSMMSGNFSTG
jgi:hypothetical protein